MIRTLAVATLVVALLGSGAAPATAAPAITLPPTSGAADYQLGGAYRPATGVTVVTRDSTSKPATGVYSICYVNGFQSQPGDRRLWLTKHKNLVLTRSGKPVIDRNWPDELILDTSTAAKRRAIARIVGKSIATCAKKGFDAVEIDNLDSYSRSKRALTASDNRALAKLYATTAHRAGLAIGQKNSAEQSARLKKAVGFDFAVAEECHRFSECSAYTRVYGSRVIDIEYTDDLRGDFSDVCTAKKPPALTVLRDRDLTPRGSSAYVFEHC